MARSKDCCCWLTNPRQLLVTVKSLSLVILLSRVDKEEIKKKKKRKKSKGRQKEIDQVQSFQDQMRFACLLTQFVCNLIPSVSWQTFQGCLQLASINRWRFAGWLAGWILPVAMAERKTDYTRQYPYIICHQDHNHICSYVSPNYWSVGLVFFFPFLKKRIVLSLLFSFFLHFTDTHLNDIITLTP